MRIAHVVSNVDNPAAGTTYAVSGLCGALAQRGLDIEMHTLEPLPPARDIDYRRIAYPKCTFPAKLGMSMAMSRGVREAAAIADVVHNHGLWMMPNIYAGTAARRAKRPFVFSAHGMLAPAAMRRSRWKKLLFGWAGQGASLAAVNCFHATSVDEYRDIRRLGFRQPVCVVPFGIDVPPEHQRVSGTRRTLLFLGRIHPIKRVDILIIAWRAVQDDFPDWDLVICGPDNEGHLPAMERLARETGAARVSFVGPKYGEEKEQLMDTCNLFVLPSFTENFGFAVAEALAHGMPVIVTRTAPWGGLERLRCGWWIDVSAASLDACLRHALALDFGTLDQMGRRGREWMRQDFSWAHVGEMMDVTYKWLLGHTECPPWVAID